MQRILESIATMLPAWLLPLAALALAPDARPAANLYPLSNVTVYDGDTIKSDVDLGFDLMLSQQSIRCLGYDAPELTRTRRTVTVTEDEIQRGRAARAALVALLADGETYIAPPEGDDTDAYGRRLGYLFVRRGGEWLDVAETMRAEGHER